MKHIIKRILPLIDVLVAPIVYPAALILKLIRIAGVQRMPLCKSILLQVGIFPIRNHYYEPLFDSSQLLYPLDRDRDLPGIDWNLSEQLNLLENFNYNEELKDVPLSKSGDLTFFLDNNTFESGDAEFWYNLIRNKKPAKIFEIGSGYSTLMARKAIKKNEEEISNYHCKHLCIEPYENTWLEQIGVTVIKQRVENLDKGIFAELAENDILFIDSSHVIRPQGDVLFEYLEILPTLKTGVIVHIHDIFSPKDYLDSWIKSEVRFWNEQYLLEAFLSHNRDWNIIGALNYLHHKYYEKLKAKSPFLTRDREPGSFYIQKVH
jgi:hypothetical protein